MVFWEASNCFLTFRIILLIISFSSMTLFFSGFEHLDIGWIFGIYPAGGYLSSSKVSFETAFRPHLLAALFYGADNRFTRKAEC